MNKFASHPDGGLSISKAFAFSICAKIHEYLDKKHLSTIIIRRV